MIFANFIIGIIVIGYCSYLLIDYSLLLPNLLLEISFMGIILLYCLVIGISIRAQRIISQWLAGYLELKSWGENLEK